MSSFKFGKILIFGLIFILFRFGAHARSVFPNKVSGLDLVTGKQVLIKFGDSRKATAVIFLSLKCPCSNSHQPVVKRLFEEFSSKGIQFVGVHSNADEELEKARAHFKASNFSFPVVHDPKSEIADQFGAYKTPHVFLISSKNEILFQGGVDNSKDAKKANRFYLKDALEAVRDGKQPPQKEVRVLGCEIKRP